MMRYFLFLIILSNLACSSVEKEALDAANKFCNCYGESFGKNGLEKTRTKCDSILISDYYLYKIYDKHIRGSVFAEISPSLRDSVKRFMNVFTIQVNKNCPGYFYSR